MSFTHFPDPIACPECGLHTHELWHETDEKNKILMCEACWEDSEEEGKLDEI